MASPGVAIVGGYYHRGVEAELSKKGWISVPSRLFSIEPTTQADLG